MGPVPGEYPLAGPVPVSTAFPAESRSERWMWQELPSRLFGLAMKVMLMPSAAAISFAPVL